MTVASYRETASFLSAHPTLLSSHMGMDQEILVLLKSVVRLPLTSMQPAFHPANLIVIRTTTLFWLASLPLTFLYFCLKPNTSPPPIDSIHWLPIPYCPTVKLLIKDRISSCPLCISYSSSHCLHCQCFMLCLLPSSL